MSSVFSCNRLEVEFLGFELACLITSRTEWHYCSVLVADISIPLLCGYCKQAPEPTPASPPAPQRPTQRWYKDITNLHQICYYFSYYYYYWYHQGVESTDSVRRRWLWIFCLQRNIRFLSLGLVTLYNCRTFCIFVMLLGPGLDEK